MVFTSMVDLKLRQAGIPVNAKRVHRLCVEARLGLDPVTRF